VSLVVQKFWTLLKFISRDFKFSHTIAKVPAANEYPMSDAVSKPQHKARRFPRYPLDIRVTVHVFRDGKTVSFWGRSTEFGADGISATLTGEIESGEVVSMELSLPSVTFPLKLRAIVRYHHGLRHGFEFLARSPEQSEAIRHLCETMAARE
jgi:PilZ domain